nr:GPI mannosyltransferase 4 [Onthophagus taurus]
MKKLNSDSFLIYYGLCLLRILLVLTPQNGYIHPDEFFQSIEVFASNIFELDGNIPWDFNVTFPIRSIGPQYVTTGLSYNILKMSSMLFKGLITPYSLLVTPRLFICLLSFLCDWSVYKICKNNNERYKSKLVVLSSSYVMLIFGTRTFSNTLELISFALLLYFVAESMIFSNVIVKHHEYLRKRYEKSKTPAEKARFHKLRLFLASHSFRNFFQISVISVFGVFNRPTFLFFAVFPVFFWLNRGMGFKSVSNMQFHLRMLVLILSSVPVIIILVVIDSFYYGYISWGELGMLDVSIDSFVVPGLNFIKYNLKDSKEHGLHPRYLHVLVNIPLLFNVMGVYVFVMFGDFLIKFSKKKYHLLPTIRSIKGLMITSLLVPILLLSYIPHQEPRFLIPLIIPLSYIFSEKIYQEPERSVIKIEPTTEINKKEFKSDNKLTLWIILNLIFGIFFGFIHQGGIYPASNYLSSEIAKQPNTKYNIFTSNIYMVPQILYKQPKIEKIYESRRTKFQMSKRVFFYEEGSNDLSSVYEKMVNIVRVSSMDKRKNRFFMLLPASLNQQFNNVSKKYNFIEIELTKKFYPHLSTEALPNFNELFYLLTMVDFKNLHFDEISNSFLSLLKSFSLNLYEIKMR